MPKASVTERSCHAVLIYPASRLTQMLICTTRTDPRPRAMPSAQLPAYGGVLLPAHNMSSSANAHSFSDTALTSSPSPTAASLVSPTAAAPLNAATHSLMRGTHVPHPLQANPTFPTKGSLTQQGMDPAHSVQGLSACTSNSASADALEAAQNHMQAAHHHHHHHHHYQQQQQQQSNLSNPHSTLPHVPTKRSSHQHLMYDSQGVINHSTQLPSHSTTHTTKRNHHHQRRSFLRLGILMCITMTAHNMPEGFAVAFSAYTHFGPLMAVAIALHNIPEGIIIAAPIYAATGSRARALGWASASVSDGAWCNAWPHP